MSVSLLNDRDLEFLLYEFLDTEALVKRSRYSDHSREVFSATLATAKTIANDLFANHNRKGDENEPAFDGKSIEMIPETKIAWDAFAAAGFLEAHYDYEEGGLQLPEVVLRAAVAYFNAANISTTAYPFLSIAAANLINSFASDEHKARFLPPMQQGRFSGTMALTEPGQGSALADITTTATPHSDGTYRVVGQKMYISGGDQAITENIIHLVLAKIKGAPLGVGGISLFIVPKFLVNDDGSCAQRNDVALAGLLHKMGYRNTTSTVLSFGENDGAVGYLVGEPHKGLSYMFQMMNEARIAVGAGAAALGYQGYNASLEYARGRPQGRLPSNKDPASKQVNIVEHADVRRMLLAQKAYAEGALAMCLYASSLFEDSTTAESSDAQNDAAMLLDLITPVIKSWPSKYGLLANELAIQVLGGAGYTREYPVEQYYRDNRLNPIHEGTEAIHGLDILARKVHMNDGRALKLLMKLMNETAANGSSEVTLASYSAALVDAIELLQEVTNAVKEKMGSSVDLALANATLYLDLFGRIFAAWIWLRQALIATKALNDESLSESDQHFYLGKVQAARYYFKHELPFIAVQANILKECEASAYEMEDNWF